MHDQPVGGPFVHLESANVGSDQAFPADGAIELAFDRMLLPSTVTRQSVTVTDLRNQPLTPIVEYDPVTRIVRLSSPDPAGVGWLEEGQSYRVLVGRAADDGDLGGLRAIDRAPLDRATRIGFLAGRKSGAAPREPRIRFCNDVLPLFVRCGSAGCHGHATSAPPITGSAGRTIGPAMGLALDDAEGVRRTAVGRAAQQANTGPRAGGGATPGRVFAVDMPLIEPGNPGNSYLLYKLLLAAPPDEPTSPSVRPKCNGGAGSPPVGPFPVASTTYSPLPEPERQRLGNYIRGNAMPFPDRPGMEDRSQNLTFDELERVRAWIAQGANVVDCGGCEP